MKKKIGLIDLFIDEWHSNHYPQWFKEAPRGNEFELAYAWEEKTFPGKRPLEKWCGEMNMIPAQSIEEIIEKCDCFCVLAPANPEVHERLAKLALESGKPLYIDKPFTNSRVAAERIFALAEKHDTPLMSSSALRYGSELLSGRLQAMKPDIFCTTGGGRSFPEYAIHQLEMIVSVMGTEVENMILSGDAQKLSLTLEYSGSRIASVAYSPMFPFSIAASNAKESQMYPEITNTFQNMTAAILDFFATGKVTVPKNETLTIVSLLEQATELLNR